MSLARREFLARTAGGLLAASVPAGVPLPAWFRRTHIKAIAFDAFPIFDPRPISALAEELAPGRGAELVAAWRTRQFEYTWLRTLSNHYLDFWQITEAALTFAAASLKLKLDSNARDRLMGSYLLLPAWPDVRPALESLRMAGIRMAFLSNFTSPMLDACAGNAGLRDFFGEHLSTDRVRAFKPHPRAYAMALTAFGLPRGEIAFAAFAGWDAAGAKWFGLPTIWVNRVAAAREELGVTPDWEVGGLQELASVVLA